MSVQPPKIDKRTYDDLVAQTESLAQKFTNWQPRADGQPDAGRALVRIFSRMAALVSDRLNQVPEKNFLAFLNLIGTQIHPPQPARVPLTFSLVEGSPDDAFVPANTPVAAPAAEGEDEIVFELEDELVVTRSQLQAVYVRQPQLDRYSDQTAAATGQVEQDYPVFMANEAIAHHLYLACDDLWQIPGRKKATLTLNSPAAVDLQKLPITWSYWDAEKAYWKTLKGIVTGLAVTLDPNLPRIRITAGTGITPQGEELNLATDQEINLRNDGEGRDHTGKTVLLLLEKTAAQVVVMVRQVTGNISVDHRVCLAVLQVSDAASGAQVSYAPLSPGRTDNATWTVVFDALPALTPHAIAGEVAPWIRATLDTPLPLNRANLPIIESVTTQIEINPTGTPQDQNLSPDRCIFNTVPLDLEKDVFPFGEQPRANDTFYLASREVLLAGQTVILTVTLRKPGVVGDEGIEVLWECWNGIKWMLLGKSIIPKSTPPTIQIEGNTPTTNSYQFSDSTEAFTKASGAIKFTIPVEIAAKTINGEENYWVRSRIVRGDYGKPATSKKSSSVYPGTTIPIYELSESTLNPPVIESLILNYTLTKTSSHLRCLTYNDFTYTRPPTHAPFQPFTPTSDQDPALYLGFDRPFSNRPVTLYAQVTSLAPGRLASRATRIQAREFAHAQQAKLKVEQVHGFAPGQAIRIAPGSGVQEDHEIAAIQPDSDTPSGELTLRSPLAYTHAERTRIERIPSMPRLRWEYSSPQGWHPLGVQDQTAAFTERGTIRWIGPTDFVQRAELGQSLYWLRLRWDGGEFLAHPRLQRVLINTTWATQAVKIEQEVLGSSTGNPEQRFFVNQYPILPGQQLDVQEDLPPIEQERLVARSAEPFTLIRNEAGEVEEVWVRWQEVPDFYGSAPGDRHYILNHLTGEVQFGDGQRGKVPPLGRQNIRLTHYWAGGGKQGNKPAETITQLKTTVPYIDHVTNLEPATGAADQESLAWVKERGPKQLRHRGRAVTAQDLEDLAFEASSDVARARAVTPEFSDALEWLPTYHVPLKSAERLELVLSWTGATIPTLQVAFYSSGQAIAWHQQAIFKDQTLTFSTPSWLQSDGEILWRVVVTNPHAEDVTDGIGSIIYPQGSQTIEFSRLNNHPHSQVVDAGRVELLIVPRSLANQPTPSLGLLNRVEAYLKHRCASTLSLHVTEPDWIEVVITATLVPLSLQGADSVRERALRTLTRFLHPLTGGPTGRGWSFGRRPHQSDIYAVLESVEGVDFVRDLVIDERSPHLQGPSPHFLIYSGTHDLRLAQP